MNSTTSRNLALITKETGVQAETISPSQVRKLVKVQPIPINQEWRGPLLLKLLNERKEIAIKLEKTDAIDKVIDSLCSS